MDATAPAGSITAVPCSASTRSASALSSHSVAATFSGANAASTARPVTPAPVTRTGAPGVSSDRSSSPPRPPDEPATSGPDCGEPLAVEQGHTQTTGDRRQQPKP